MTGGTHHTATSIFVFFYVGKWMVKEKVEDVITILWTVGKEQHDQSKKR